MATNQISTAPYLLSDANQASYRYNGELPPEESLEQQALNRRQHIASLLMQQGLAGTGTNKGQMVGRFYVPGSPVQGLADLAKIAAGAYGTYKTDQDRAGLAEQNRALLADAIANYKQGTSDVPAVPGSPQAGPPQVAEAMASQPTPVAAPVSMEAMPQGPPASPMTGSGYQMGPDESGWAPKGPIQDLNAAPPTPAPQEAVAQAMMQQPPPMQGPMSPGTPGRERTADEKRQALIDLMASQHPQAAGIGRLLEQQEAKKEERQMLHEEKQAALEANAEQKKLLTDIQQKQFEMTYANSTRQLDQQYEINKDRLSDTRLDHAARTRLEEDQRRIEREKLAWEKEKTTKELANQKEIAGMKAGKGAAMSATAQKELFEADDTIAASKNVIGSLDRALELNSKAYDGATASTRAKALGYVPGKYADADATVELDNIVSGQALEQLRAIFGGMPTEGERKLLLELQGSVNLKASQRQSIYERGKALAQRRLALNQQKATQLREGTYFSEQGGQGAVPSASAPPGPTPAGPVPHAPYDDPKDEAAFQEYKKQERAKFLKEHSLPTP